ncbi:hypothetical protein BS329_37870 [Amycolatopsis coloradensis]|uniref:RsbT co-antagonist protein RsbRD N-terminal domain-containing protein n=1 Tax=Amycolatopsis coloradensis TaxID=76021 RepID=A0A1R0KF48_9PSEU|nr:hypothetical protein [Amycolatopsis coloradensis]OLZ43822.1 hypothetical protein BS329_37870 [Amycolatopsis coloradensis]
MPDALSTEFSDRLARLLRDEAEFYHQVDSTAPDELRQVCRTNLDRALTALAEGRGRSPHRVSAAPPAVSDSARGLLLGRHAL